MLCLSISSVETLVVRIKIGVKQVILIVFSLQCPRQFHVRINFVCCILLNHRSKPRGCCRLSQLTTIDPNRSPNQLLGRILQLISEDVSLICFKRRIQKGNNTLLCLLRWWLLLRILLTFKKRLLCVESWNFESKFQLDIVKLKKLFERIEAVFESFWAFGSDCRIFVSYVCREELRDPGCDTFLVLNKIHLEGGLTQGTLSDKIEPKKNKLRISVSHKSQKGKKRLRIDKFGL